jgi:hypothetical protein
MKSNGFSARAEVAVKKVAASTAARSRPPEVSNRNIFLRMSLRTAATGALYAQIIEAMQAGISARKSATSAGIINSLAAFTGLHEEARLNI